VHLSLSNALVYPLRMSGNDSRQAIRDRLAKYNRMLARMENEISDEDPDLQPLQYRSAQAADGGPVASSNANRVTARASGRSSGPANASASDGLSTGSLQRVSSLPM
jgi:hypothetical protein